MRLQKHLTSETTIKQMIQKLPDKIRKAVTKQPFDTDIILPVLKKLMKNLTGIDKTGSNSYTYRFKSASPKLVRTVDVIMDLMKVLKVGETTVAGDVDTTPHKDAGSMLGMTKRQQKCPEGTKWNEKKGKCVPDKKMSEKNGCSDDEYW